jgi:tRNA pseudouridine38-40 synthase
MRNIRLTVEYDGTDFHGFQRQSRLRTVQGVLETCFSQVLGEPIRVIGAGRTDAGVHAAGQVVNFATSRPVPIDKLTGVLNQALPRDVKVQSCEEVAPDFHARRCARSRMYRYTIVERLVPSPLLGRFAFVTPGRLSVPRMRAAARPLVGRRDFWALQGGGAETTTTVRTLLRLACRREGEWVTITAEADSFLYRMVRLIAGALIAVGRGEMEPGQLAAAVADRDKSVLPAPAPACGLCLVRVSY